MTSERAWELWRRWYGTAEIRKPPTEAALWKCLRVDLATWTEAAAIVKREKEEKKGQVQVFTCHRGGRGGRR